MESELSSTAPSSRHPAGSRRRSSTILNLSPAVATFPKASKRLAVFRGSWAGRRSLAGLQCPIARGTGRIRALSSVGRASRLHREGRRFEPVSAHHHHLQSRLAALD